MKEVVDYIKENWKNTIRQPHSGVPFPFTSPSKDAVYLDFFYWDTYFTNVGLLIDGLVDQVKNNIDNVSYFINSMGYMPNSNGLLNRTQPPFYSRMVKDYYDFKKDKGIIKTYMPYLLKEYDFWMTRRVDQFGMNIYKADNIMQRDLDNHYFGLSPRVSVYSDDKEMQNLIAKDLIAIAESGLDFNMRFRTKTNRVAIHEFLQLDINCLLYDVEKNIAYMAKEIDDKELEVKFTKAAEERKANINKWFLSPEGIYLDYNFVEKRFSDVVSAVSLYPYIFGISDDKEGCKKVYDLLEVPFGVTVCAYREDDLFYQWDYPIMWGEFSYLTYIGLTNVGLNKEAERVKTKFVEVVDKNFKETGAIYEKYDGLTGEVSNREYVSTDMMGWTAAAYRFFTK